MMSRYKTATELKAWIDKGDFTAWDVGSLLEAVAKGYKQVISGTKDEVTFVKEEAQGLIDHVKKVSTLLTVALSDLDVLTESTYQRYEAMSEKIYESRKRCEQAVANFPKLPYADTAQLEKTVELAERFSNLSADQWGKLIELAKAMAPRTHK